MSDVLGNRAIVPDPHHEHEWCLVNRRGDTLAHDRSWEVLFRKAEELPEEGRDG